MAYTNALLVRLILGDSGIPSRDVTDGDGATTEFWLSTPPVLPGTALVYVGGTAKSSPADYTLDEENGRLVFASPPPLGTGTVVVIYYAVQFPADDVDEACRQEGLNGSAVADTGEVPAAYAAAILLAEGMAATQATLDSGLSAAWAARATELRNRASARKGLTAGAIKRVDGFSIDRKSTDVLTVNVSPRRRYYGQEDRIP